MTSEIYINLQTSFAKYNKNNIVNHCTAKLILNVSLNLVKCLNKLINESFKLMRNLQQAFQIVCLGAWRIHVLGVPVVFVNV